MSKSPQLASENQRQGLGLKFQWYGLPGRNPKLSVVDHLSDQFVPLFVAAKGKMELPSKELALLLDHNSTPAHSTLLIIPRSLYESTSKDSYPPIVEKDAVRLLHDYLLFIPEAIKQTNPDALSLINPVSETKQGHVLKRFPGAVQEELSKLETPFTKGNLPNQLYLHLTSKTHADINKGIESMRKFLDQFIQK